MKKKTEGHCKMCIAHSCTIASLVFFIYDSMKQKKNQNSIPIINFQFEIFIRSLSKTVKAKCFYLYSCRSVHARTYNLYMCSPELSAVIVTDEKMSP